ncbi:MAG TPA: MFS transporter [Actinotalea sp.]|nr:MFS transporter [Actinotalea sp.]
MSSQQPQGAGQARELGWAPMVFIGLGLALIVMDATIVNVSLPSIIDELGIDSVDAEWIGAVYALVFASLLIIFGRLGDRYGRRRVFLLGAVVFAVASVLAAAAPTGGALIAARALQGVGGAMMSPTSLALLNALYRGRRRVIAFAIYGSLIGGMAAIGPLIGGFLTTYASWRWAFAINLPLAAAIVIGGLRFVPESREDHPEPGTDVVGAITSAVGIGALVFALIEGRSYGWWTAQVDGALLGLTWRAGGLSPVAVALAVSVGCLVVLARVEAARVRAGKVVLIDLSLFRIPTFGLGSLAALIVSMGEFGVLFSFPLFLQSALGYTALGAGALLATLALGSFLAAPTTAPLARRIGTRNVARLGMALEAVGILGLGLVVSAQVSALAMIGWLLVYGIGVGYASAQLTGIILADVPVRQSGQASGTQSTARQVGSALGTAVLGTVLFVGLAHDTEARVAEVPGITAEQAGEVARLVEQSAGTAIPTIAARPGGEPVAAAARDAFADALQRTAMVGAGFVTLGLVATLALPPARRDEHADDVPTPTVAGPA